MHSFIYLDLSLVYRIVNDSLLLYYNVMYGQCTVPLQLLVYRLIMLCVALFLGSFTHCFDPVLTFSSYLCDYRYLNQT